MRNRLSITLHILTIAITLSSLTLSAQVFSPSLTKMADWKVERRTAVPVVENGKNVINLGTGTDDGMIMLKDYEFSNGIIEVDLKGKNVIGKSFIGIAFHVLDNKVYDVIYFRPFNFSNPDTSRRSHAVQYVSAPDYPWQKLRQTFPGVYENTVKPVPNPDEWFHAKIVVDGEKIKVYVDNSTIPSLEVQKLTDTRKGGIGLWVGSDSDGSFANLTIKPKRK